LINQLSMMELPETNGLLTVYQYTY